VYIYQFKAWCGPPQGESLSVGCGSARYHTGLVWENPTSNKEVLALALSCLVTCIHRHPARPTPPTTPQPLHRRLRRACSLTCQLSAGQVNSWQAGLAGRQFGYCSKCRCVVESEAGGWALQHGSA
jgi:hypothetical protein